MSLAKEPRIKLIWLEHFRMICQESDLVQAAQKLGVSRQTLQRNLQSLADVLGKPLLQRQGRQFYITPFGRSLLQEAELLLQAVQTLPTRLQQASLDKLQGNVSVGWRNMPCLNYLVDVLVTFIPAWPDVQVRTRQHNAVAVLESLLQSGQLELALMDYPPRDAALLVCSGQHSPYVIVSVPQPLRHWSAFTYLEAEPYCPEHVAPAWDAERFPRQVELQTNSSPTFLKLLEPGRAIFVPQHLVQDYLESAQLAIVAQPPEEVFKQLYLCAAPDSAQNPAVQTLLDLLRQGL